MGSVVKSIMGGGDIAKQQKSAQGSALASLLAREAEVSTEGATSAPRRRKGRQLLTYLAEDGQQSLN
ncbi:hypothetical protein KHC23_07720 [Ancylobacter dichloromethanicus]|uniref:Uncharacterized protein n=1 Tax=Ancylobacter dichloromethanicus TaxID=518825 RepID=A0A9W6JBH8_9HYPH|nr:hypothetical protein [Ancylobacter dichloromethanicus]MBS7553534.1 hypothetical protein [Ancylobacter dichloromethanicus]GLK72593.1 hypothetical protein GCM10017643_27090 [Ancylobacter dichloromethanicus]